MLKLKQKSFEKNKAKNLYLNIPVWIGMLKIGGTGLLMSFFMALFTFIDQLMLVNLMPKTTTYNFNSLFILHNDNIFDILINHLHVQNKTIAIKAIANTLGLGLFNSADVVRSAVSLTSELIFIIQAFPGIITMGASIFYAKLLGKQQFDKAKKIWQNSIVAASLSALIGFIVLLILIPTVVPAQADLSKLNMNDLYALSQVIAHKLNILGYGVHFINNGNVTIYTNGSSYFVQILNNNKIFYLNVTNQSLIQNVVVSNHKLTNLTSFSFSLNDVLNSWNTYFSVIRTYSIVWAQQFLYIMDLGLILECFASLFVAVLRAEGELKYTTIVTIFCICLNILLNYVFIAIAQIGMEGAASASVIGFIVQLICFIGFIQYSKNSKIKFNDLKNLKIEWKDVLLLTKIGSTKLVGAIGSMILLILLTNQMTYVCGKLLPANGSEYYISILGAVMPFINLFFSCVGGFAKNVVQMYSYNFALKNQTRVKQAYWFSFIYILILGLIIFVLFGLCQPIQTGVLSWFHITASSANNQLISAQKLMLIWMSEVPVFAFMTNALIVYLVAGKVKTANLVNLLRTIIIPIPVLFIFSYLSVNQTQWFNYGAINLLPNLNNAMWFFMSAAPVYTAFYSLVLFIMSTIFLYTTMFKSKEEIDKKYQFDKNQSNKIPETIVISDTK